MYSITSLKEGDIIRSKSQTYKFCRLCENERDILIVQDIHGIELAMNVDNVEEIGGETVGNWNKNREMEMSRQRERIFISQRTGQRHLSPKWQRSFVKIHIREEDMEDEPDQEP